MPQASRLFTLTSWLLKAAAIACAALMVVLVLAVGALVLVELGVVPNPIPPSALRGVDMGLLLQAGVLALVACLFCVALVAVVLLLLARIVDSARAGDPFVMKNATRLNTIGGLLLALQGVGFATGIAISLFPKPISHDFDLGFDVSLSGLFAVLLVFVLAQIFQRGSEMRAELEGTI